VQPEVDLDETDDAAEDDENPAASDAPQEHFEVSADEHGQRLDRVLAARFANHSRSHLQTLIESGEVLLAGSPCRTASRKLRVGEPIDLRLKPPMAEQAFEPEPMSLDIRHGDEHVWVLCKPAGLVVHPAAGNWRGTLLNGLLAMDPRLSSLPRAGIVHRLDKDTSGLMVVARSAVAMTQLVRALADRDVQRSYLAIAHGAVQPASFTVDAPIGRDPTVRVRMAVRSDGRPSRTGVEVLAGKAVSPTASVSALACRLHTGRTHQIRVHLAHRGHPLVADAVYGGKPALGMSRQALHAARLAFSHPVTGRDIAIEAAPPADFAGAWAQIMES
jgi:23S rRNA pseudouridine1911/1915/1917 synthase